MKLNPSTTASSPLRFLLAILPFAGIAEAYEITGDVAITGSIQSGTSDTAGGTEVRLGGLVIAKGTYNNSPSLLAADQGAGTRLLWHPRKASVRAGQVTGTEWDDVFMGIRSTAFGFNTTASGAYSTALGRSTFATGQSSFAAGYVSTASGSFSVAAGRSVTGSGGSSLATGYGTTAQGDFSAAFGLNTLAGAYGSVAIGVNNIGGGTANLWIPTDPLFEIGNAGATPSAAPGNALTVYKNGNMDVKGVITCAPGGDIPMFGE